MVVVNTVKENMEGFTHRQITGNKTVRSTMAKCEHPSDANYKDMVRSNMITRFPVIPADIDTANKILVCEIPYLKGKTARRQTPPVVSDYVAIPKKFK